MICTIGCEHICRILFWEIVISSAIIACLTAYIIMKKIEVKDD